MKSSRNSHECILGGETSPQQLRAVADAAVKFEMRTVKTCIGSEWRRFGVRDSTRLGIEMEELTWGSWTPHKFKLAVSGWPRNRAKAHRFKPLRQVSDSRTNSASDGTQSLERQASSNGSGLP